MSDAAAMRLIESVGNVRTEFQNLLDRQRAFFKALGESFSFDALHYEVVDSILLAHVVQNTNVRMIQAGNGFGLAFEALLTNGV